MKSMLRRRPSPAMFVALVAVVMASGGSSYAADGVEAVSSALASNSVGSKQIKNKQVKNADLGLNAVQSKNVADNSLDGADIAESRLGTVPKAATADNATNAANATTAANATNADKVDGKDAADFVPRGESQQFYATREGGQTADLVKYGPFTIRMRCESSGGTDSVFIEIESSVDAQTSWVGPIAAGVPETIAGTSVGTGSTAYFNNIDRGSALAPDGSWLAIDAETMGMGLNVFGHRCFVAGQALTQKGTL